MSSKNHGGRRPNQTGRPRHTVQKTEQVKARFTPEEIERLDLLRQPGESRAACIRRLVLAALSLNHDAAAVTDSSIEESRA
jgi:hypothetical protein